MLCPSVVFLSIWNCYACGGSGWCNFFCLLGFYFNKYLCCLFCLRMSAVTALLLIMDWPGKNSSIQCVYHLLLTSKFLPSLVFASHSECAIKGARDSKTFITYSSNVFVLYQFFSWYNCFSIDEEIVDKSKI